MRAALLALTLLEPLLVPGPMIGQVAPALPGHGLAAGVEVVDFFATWCGPCHQAMAALDEIVRRRGVKLVVVDVGEPPERVHAFFAAHPLPPGAELVLDATAEAARRWGARRFPTTFILRDGVIRHINRGYGPGYPLRVDGWIAGLKP